MQNTYKKIAFFLFLSSVVSVNSFSQTTQDTNIIAPVLEAPVSKYWLTLGYGVSTISDAEFTAAVGAIFNYQRGKNFFSARVVHDMSARDDIIPREQIFDVAVLAGIGDHDSLLYGNASIGVSYAYVLKRFGPYDTTKTIVNPFPSEQHHVPGLALQLAAFSRFSPTGSTGLGATLCLDFNSARNFFLFLISFEIGHF
jgi:hypothetical protein